MRDTPPAPGGWLAWRLLRETIARLHQSYEAVPQPMRRRWWRTILLGMLAVQLLSLLQVWVARRLVAAGALAWEEGVVRWFDTEAPFSFNTAMWLEGIANGFVLWGVMLAGGWMAARRRRPFLALSFWFGYTAVYFPIITGWTAWDRDRPRIIMGGIGTPGGFFDSFPSGHMVQAAFAHGLLLWLWYRDSPSTVERLVISLGYLSLAAVVGASRLRLGAHWPSDVAAGFVLGAAWLAVVLRAHRHVPRDC